MGKLALCPLKSVGIFLIFFIDLFYLFFEGFGHFSPDNFLSFYVPKKGRSGKKKKVSLYVACIVF